MVLKIHGAVVTPYTQLVLLILYEKQVPFEFVPVDITVAEHRGEKHRENQPFGLVPFMDDDGFILHESRAIAQYIEIKYSHKGTQGLVPKPEDLPEYARYLQAASIESNYFAVPAVAIIMEKIFNPFYKNIKTDDKVYNDCVTKLTSNLDVYESILGKQKYIGGDKITFADLYHLPLGTLLPLTGTNVIQSRPNVSRWFSELASRKAWKEVQALEGIRPKMG